ncbi:MAG TPA: GNAT family N-acetyltransferase [Gammaproteobacteria bacterium]|nr:GNAT family N-acetyltransferase [Gammaproteobacteria bacterium]
MNNDYYISTNNILLYKEKIWFLLRDCFWSKNIPIEYVEKFIKHSLCFGVCQKNSNQLIGFGRVITDFTTYAYVCDIVIDPHYRKKGLGSALIKTIICHPELQGLKTWSLKTTEEARKMYEKNGFSVVEHHETQLEINDLEIYSCPTFVNIYKHEK